MLREELEECQRTGRGWPVHEKGDFYCWIDVKILTHSLVKYRTLIKGITKIDIIQETLTIASHAVQVEL